MRALAIPRASAIAPLYQLAGDADYTAALAMTLLDAGLIGDECVRGKPPRSFAEVCRRAIAPTFATATTGLRTFDWHLHVLAGTELYAPDDATAFFCMMRPDTVDQWPVIEIGARIMELESTLPGLGQTALALLYDALDCLPAVYTPRTALWSAEYVHWYGERDEELAVEEMLGWMTPEEAKDATVDVFRRAEFFSGIPEWATFPERVLTKRDIQEAAKRDGYAAAVIASCDAISALAQHSAYFPSVANDAQCELVGASALIRWHSDDAVLRLWDDHANTAIQGEHVDACTAVAIPVKGNDLRAWLEGLPRMGELARRVETLLDLIGERTA
ncbi:PRTRC system protein F [Pandoraea commovens]|uniref:PRTRC system protein F n=1 Tax=Pandoraea commovens TaxID=2508289 RepID=A0ABY5QJW9_9BURK|nr:PRTRC system protein F [Pandoraea commovens]UVA80443.1 PRTRC system protein F [Pandoraea commovens]